MAKFNPVQILGFSDRNNLAEKLDQNFQRISDAIENTLSRDGTTPNQMEDDLDLNYNRIINVADPVSASDIATKGYVDNWTSDVTWKGPWSNTVTYFQNDVVEYAGSTYICKNDNTTSASGTPDTSADWDLMTKKGHTPVWRGSWATGVTYSYLDMYEHNGASYVCTQDHVSSADTEPGVGANWTTYQDTIALSVPSDGSITTAKLADGSVTTAKLADDSVTPAKIASTQDFTFRYVYSGALLAENNPYNDNVGGRIRLEPPVNAIKADASSIWNSGFQIDTDGVGEDFFKFTWKDNGGVWRSYKLPLNIGGYVWADDNFAARISALTANTSPAGTESVACDDGKKVTLAKACVISESIGTSGYVKLANGLIVQWGVVTISANQTTITFNIAFPSACYAINVTARNEGDTDGSSGVPVLASIPSTTGVTVSTFSAHNDLHWIAIGI